MARAQIRINGVNTQFLHSSILKESERAVDVASITFAGNQFPEENDLIEYQQDMIDLANLKLFYGFEDNLLEESGKRHDGRMSDGGTGSFVQAKRRGVKAIDFNGTDYLIVDESEPDEVANKNLLSQHKLNDDLKEASGNNAGTDGIITGSETYVQGKFTKAFDFLGTNYITINNDPLYDFQHTDAFSVSFWIKTAGAVAAAKGIVTKSIDLTTALGWKIYHDATGLIKFSLSDGTTEYNVTSVTQIDDADWHHVVCVYDGTSNRNGLKIYIDDNLDATGTASTISNTILNNESVVLGAESDGGNKFVGQMDDVRQYDIALSTANITLLNTSVFDLDRTDSFSFAFWLKKNGLPAGEEILLDKDSVGAPGWRISITTTGTIRVRLVNTASSAEIDVESTNIVTNNSYHIIVVAYAGTGLASGVKLYIDGSLETLTITTDNLGANTLLNNNPITIGASFTGTLAFTGALDDARIYGRVMPLSEVTILNLRGPTVSILKFAGRVWKIAKDIGTKSIEVKSLGKIIGEQEVRGTVFNNKSPEFIVQNIIQDNTDLAYIDFGTPTTLTIEQYIADGKLVDVISDMARFANRIWYIDPLARFHFEPFNVIATDMKFTHGKDSRIFETGEDDTELVNDLIVLGQNTKYQAFEEFSGDGSTLVFTLVDKPVSMRVTVNGIEGVPEVDYFYNTENKTLTFDPLSVPTSGTDNIDVDYEYEKPLFIRQIRRSSVNEHGVRAKRLVMPWIRTYADGVRFVSSYLNVFSIIKKRVDVDIPGLENRLKENHVIILVNAIKGINDSFVVKSIKWDYPKGITVVSTGEFSFSEHESKKQVLEKIHDLESALTTSKDIQEYESAELVLDITDFLTQDVSEQFLETIVMSDAIQETERFRATYSTANYSIDDVYTGGGSH